MKILQLGRATLQDNYDKFSSLKRIEEFNPEGFFDEFFLFILASSEGNQMTLRRNVHVREFRRVLPWPMHLVYVTAYLAIFCFKKRPDIIQAKNPYEMGLMAFMISKLTGIPFCVSLHADYDKCYEIHGGAPTFLGSRKIPKRLERFILSRCPMVMPIREYLAEYAVRNGAKRDAIRLIPHGVDLSRFKKPVKLSFKSEIGLDKCGKIISFAGRLNKENYVYDILEAGKILKGIRGPDFRILIAGDGKEREAMEKIVEKEDIGDVVSIIGFQPYEAVLDIRRISDVNLCLMGGFSLIESCASGNPVISYDVDWHHELVRDNDTGFLVREGDVRCVAERINYLLNNPEDAKRLGEKAKKLAFERHSIEKASKIKIGCYRDLVARMVL